MTSTGPSTTGDTAAVPAAAPKADAQARRNDGRGPGPRGVAGGGEVPLADRWYPLSAAALDPVTIACVSAAELPAVGQRCLAVAAGASRVPGWFAELVGPAGAVVATDTDPARLLGHTGVARRRQDWQQPPADGFDLIWIRLAMAQRRHPDRLLHGLAAGLNGGGALVVEEWYWPHEPLVFAAPSPRDRRLVLHYLRLLVDQVLPATGVDLRWVARVPEQMTAAGLAPVEVRVDTPVWAAGSKHGWAAAAYAHRHRPGLLAIGMTVGELGRLTQLFTNPHSGLVMTGPAMFSVVGRKPRNLLAHVQATVTGNRPPPHGTAP